MAEDGSEDDMAYVPQSKRQRTASSNVDDDGNATRFEPYSNCRTQYVVC